MHGTRFWLTLTLAAAVVAPTAARAADCSNVKPWVNEFDYDDLDGLLNDRDEFVEIAAPAGTDLGGIQFSSVEGNPSLAFPFCSTGLTGTGIGEAHFSGTIPASSIVGDDTGTGVGFYVLCFTNTSTNVANCDQIITGVATDSNLKNGKLVNGGADNCPDGVLLHDDQGNLLDAISWEGIIPNQGPLGAFFNAPNPSYNSGTDSGGSAGQSRTKTTHLGRATGAGEWANSPVGSHTPGVINPGQSLVCDPPQVCGNSILEGTEACDDGNSVSEDGCSDVCVVEFCGDSTLQAGLGEQCDDGGTVDGDGCSAVCLVEGAPDVPSLPTWGAIGLALVLGIVGAKLARSSTRRALD